MQQLNDKLRHDQSDIEIHSQGSGQEQRYIVIYFLSTKKSKFDRAAIVQLCFSFSIFTV